MLAVHSAKSSIYQGLLLKKSSVLRLSLVRLEKPSYCRIQAHHEADLLTSSNIEI